MKQKTIPRWLLWAVWITAGLCVAAVVALALLAGGAQSGEVSLSVTEASEPAETSVVPEEVPEETKYPVLDLPENPYTPEDFETGGQFLACTAGDYKIGVDVSAWQNKINWPLVQAAGVDFAMIRLAWRGSTEGGIQKDKRAEENYNGARDAGLPVGGYFFSQAISVEEAVQEAEYVLDMIRDWQIDMPIVFDWERSANRTADVDPRTLTDCTIAFCRTIEEAGYEAMCYFNIRQFCGELYAEELEDYDFWLAMYDAPMTFPYRVDMWQYTQSGSVPGIETDVDLNILFEYE